jgi:DnaJ-class molecular chaperone
MDNGLPTEDMTLDSPVLCPECYGRGWVQSCGPDHEIWVGKCHHCEGDGVVPLYWAMENVA